MKSIILQLLLLFFSQSMWAICEINFTPITYSDDGFFVFDNNSLPFMSGNGIDENILYVWDFGDGSSDSTYYTQSYGLHQYTAEGIYEVCLTEYYYIWGQFSCTASSCQTIEVDISAFGCDEGETPLEVNITACCNLQDQQFISYAIYSGAEVLAENFVYNGEIYLDPMPGEETNLHCIQPGCYVILFDFVKMFSTPENLDISLNGNFSEEYQVLETYQGYPSLISFCIEEPGINCATSITSQAIVCNVFSFEIDNFENGAAVQLYPGDGSGPITGGPVFNYQYALPGEYTVCAMYSSPSCPDPIEFCTDIVAESCDDSCAWQFDYQHIACGYYHLFNADSLETGTTYFVDWGDGTSNITGIFDTHVYITSGIYELCVTRTDEECGPITSCVFIDVDACDGDCTLEIETLQGVGFNYVFNASGNPSDLPLYWSVNDGTPAEGDVPFEINFGGNGAFTVCAWYESVGCGIVEDCIEITLTDSLCPNEITITSEPLCHQFTFEVNNWGESQFGNIGWNFGDTEGYGMNEFLHMYAEPGVYTVCAEGTTEACPGGFYLCTELVVEACGGNEDGCPEIIWSNMINDCGLWHFEAGIPTSNENATIIWDFGDGTSTTDFNTIADHQYTADGIYTVTVNIQLYGNDCAPTIFLETTITVNACEINLCDIDIFSMAGDSCGVMIFEAGSFVEGEAFIWYFGDGNSEEGGHYIEHTYAEPGIYNVYCVFSNALCQGWQESTTITVDDCISTCSDVFVTLFSDVTNGGPETAFWNISTLDMDPVANGVIEFTDQNPYIDFAYCLDDGCYMLTLEGLGVGMTELFEPGVQMNGLSVVQELNTFNDNLIEIVFGVNSNCVDGISDTSTTGINIYPNPASNLLTINQTNGEKIELIELWDGAGRLIQTKAFSNQLDVSQIANGTYMVRVTSSNKTKVLPLQIHH